MSKSFRKFLNFYKFSTSNNFSIYDDYIIFDSLFPSFLGYSITPLNMDFRKFFKHSLKKSLLKNLLSLYFFKFQHLTKINVFKDNKIFHFTNPYKEFSRVVSYPVDNDFDFFLTITFKNPLKGQNFDIFKTISFNDYINELSKKGFKRMRDYFRRHYQLELKRKLYNMNLQELELIFGFVPTSEDIEKYIKSEVKKFISVNYKYFKVYEVHKSNVLHIHCLIKFPEFFINMDFQDMIEKIASWFETEKNGVELDRIRKNKNGFYNIKSYILKYMNKQFLPDNLFYVENENKEKIYLLKTSAFITNFISRLISYSRNVKRKKFRPFSNFYIEEFNDEFLNLSREIDLIQVNIEKKDYQEYKLIVDRFIPISKKLFNNYVDNQIRIGQAIYLLNEFLNDRYFSIKNIRKSLDVLKFNEDYKVLYINANNKFIQLLEELEDDLNNDYVDF
jgi:hypothetical protein